MPDAYPAREMRVDRAHATLKHRARKAVELEVDESLRRGRVRGKATQHVREEAQQGTHTFLRVVQMVRVPQRQDVREPGGHLEVRLRESEGRRRREKKVRQDRGPGDSSEGARGGGSARMYPREIASAAAAVRSAVSRTFTTHSGPSGDPRSSLRIADNAEATTCGSSASSLSRDTFARRAPSRSAREAGVAPHPSRARNCNDRHLRARDFNARFWTTNHGKKRDPAEMANVLVERERNSPSRSGWRARPWDRARVNHPRRRVRGRSRSFESTPRPTRD